MKKGRFILAAVLALAFVVGATAKAGNDGELVFDETYDISGSLLRLESDRGGVHITGENRDDVLIEVRAEGIDVEDARDLLDLQVKEISGGLEVTIKMEERRGLFGFFGGNREGNVWVEVFVPRRTDLNIDNGSGGIKVKSIDGDVTVDNGSGGVKLTDIEGRVDVDNGSGGIKIENVRGEVSVDNGSGGIKMEKIKGDVSVDNSSGGVKLEEIEGQVEVDNGSGGVKIELYGRNYGIDVENSSGGVVVEVPADWGADLDLRSRSRHLNVRGFRDIDLGDAGEYHGRIGGGGAMISLSSGSGTVELIGR